MLLMVVLLVVVVLTLKICGGCPAAGGAVVPGVGVEDVVDA